MKLFYTSVIVAALSLNATAFAKTCDLAIEGNDQMKFNKSELTVEAGCTEVKLTLKHTGKMKKEIMGHNWLLTSTADKATVTKAAEKAGPKNGYIPVDKKGVLANTTLIGGGETTTVTFSTKGLKKGGDYTYVCTFPSHAALMHGKLIVK